MKSNMLDEKCVHSVVGNTQLLTMVMISPRKMQLFCFPPEESALFPEHDMCAESQ